MIKSVSELEHFFGRIWVDKGFLDGHGGFVYGVSGKVERSLQKIGYVSASVLDIANEEIRDMVITNVVTALLEEQGALHFISEYPVEDEQDMKCEDYKVSGFHVEEWEVILASLERFSCGFEQTDPNPHCCDANELVIRVRELIGTN